MKLYEISEPGRSPNPHQDMASDVIGIDLGTTNSLVAIFTNNTAQIISDQNGNILPSVVHFNEQGDIISTSDAFITEHTQMISTEWQEKSNLEAAATQQYLSIAGFSTLTNSSCESNRVYKVKSFKRLIGKSLAETKALALDKFFNLDTHSIDIARVKVQDKSYSAIELSSIILKQLKNKAEQALGKNITKAVITVPAYFNDIERQATKEAAILAGLDVMRLINEPTAAALAYGLDQKVSGNYIVYDLGGGTFDISILALKEKIFHVIATKGDTNLGGDDFDHLIAGYLAKKYSITLGNKQALAVARKLKETLTTNDNAQIDNYKLTTHELEQLSKPLINKTIKLLLQAISDANLEEEQINGIILVGGSTRMPIIQQALKENFDITILDNLNPDEIVAKGAAIQAHNLAYGSDSLLIDVIPLSIGIELMGGIVERIIPRNSTIPASFHYEYTTYQDGQTAMIFNIVQGERELAQDCRLLGKFTISGIPPMKAGMAKIQVKFVIDADGILTVIATEKSTGKSQTIHVSPGQGLHNAQIREMLISSIEKSEEDFIQRKLIESRVEAERVIMALESIIKEDIDLVSENEAKQIKDRLTILKKSIISADSEQISADMQQLEEVSEVLIEQKFSKQFGKAFKGKSLAELNRSLLNSKTANQVQGAYGTETRNGHAVHEDPNIGAT
ncbi:Hsp70 family protein [Rickettsiales endosymbiont of Stachyamoeba lipophora]|uniref:Hsp70 family protein n=1 Tax=Rickettsiales endosymbiont of Stachyamoeba lipophora TaxID=2486578 RepID=UPI000F64632D|nr:Hsp70 family protein [Rickettsiales endosymbiont of Stachyamoeba lipophora]AZL15218.1 Fe-S protein assembly chaperone HscA [Rickettsiales endosymbiont of Stachyamoeba lipophora]